MRSLLLVYIKVAPLLAIIIICPFNISGQEKEKETGKIKEEEARKEISMYLDTVAYSLYTLQNGDDLQGNLDYGLMTAATEGDSLGITWLIRHGADIDARTSVGVTPLLFAVAANQKVAVKLLLDYKSDPNAISWQTETPLIVAVKNQNIEITEMLLRAGADINLGDKYDATPLHYAAVYGYFYIADLIIYYDAAIYKRSTDGTTPLMAATWAGYADIADMLMQNGADPSEKDNLGFSPFLIAAQNGDTVIMNLLLKRRVNIYDTNKFKYNALDLSIKGNHKNAVIYLLRIGDKWASTVNDVINPQSVAIVYGRKELSDILKVAKIPESEKPGIDQISITASLKHCLFDYQTGFSVTGKEPVHNFGFLAGIDFKPFYTRVLIKEDEFTYYQYRDKSAMIYAGILKEISLTDYPLRGNWSFKASLSGGYTFGNKIKGTSIIPGNKFKLIPAAGFRWTKNTFSLNLDLEYFNTDYYHVGPIWFRIGFSYNIFINDFMAPGKVIKWY
jgi:ankyrin repeat protein